MPGVMLSYNHEGSARKGRPRGHSFPLPRETHATEELAPAQGFAARAEKPSQTVPNDCGRGQAGKERDSLTPKTACLVIMIASGIRGSQSLHGPGFALHSRFSQEGTPVVRMLSSSLRARTCLAA